MSEVTPNISPSEEYLALKNNENNTNYIAVLVARGLFGLQQHDEDREYIVMAHFASELMMHHSFSRRGKDDELYQRIKVTQEYQDDLKNNSHLTLYSLGKNKTQSDIKGTIRDDIKTTLENIGWEYIKK